MIRRPRRRLLYPYAWLSLAVFPFLSLCHLDKTMRIDKPFNMLEVCYWSPRDSDFNPFSRVDGSFIRFNLNGDANDDKEIQYAQSEMRRWRQGFAGNGIEFTFSANAKYKSLVKLFNICEIEKPAAYLNYKKKFVIFKRPPAPLPPIGF